MSQSLVNCDFSARDLVKVRGAIDETQVLTTWTGSLYALVPGEARKHLFNIVGMNVGRCIENQDGTWNFVSRELTYYTDIHTGEIVRNWQNPWTDEWLPVVHVANNPVQICLQGNYPATVAGDATTFIFDMFLDYPNPLAGDERFSEYSPESNYKAAEFFKLTVPTQELLDPQTISIKNVSISWHRLGPWLPWMKMGARQGQLIYSACGSKVEKFTDLPQVIQEEIDTRIPLYRNAPELRLAQKNMTSWFYFKRHFKAYLRGETFPVPELAPA
ncbi:DUF1838 domain-containing protein [Leptolyngbya sp. FACHB-261]|uniref:DUF1838 domain-containing protein n=1 Tax=Leptolyngbya sp. FACHB-261 TaxID=2692806 RepID=UPI0016877BEE|nr:DUF1838 domain-containing protein [Leptolyngbya sp. FACHB-261]MBD2104190.1 DUF1838 domain-containing protein [Leptolyngbya sp. FACHB-261]